MTKKPLLYTMGDAHFCNARDWDKESFGKFIKWFKEDLPVNNSHSELLQLGDLTEKALNEGATLAMLTEWAEVALQRFDKIYIVGGNHDDKYDVMKDEEHYSSEYLAEMDNRIQVIYKETEFEVLNGSLKVLALPFRHVPGSLEKYYSEQLDSKYYDTKYDLICGHTAIKDPALPHIPGVDLSRFHYKYAAFGHIHDRSGPNARFYTGSIMPFRKNEEKTALPRCFKVYSDDGQEAEIELPIFRQYHVGVDKPEHKKNSTDVVHIYELNDPKKVVDYADEYYVKKSLATSAINALAERLQTVEAKARNSASLFDDDLTVLEKMCKEQGIALKRKTKAILKKLLS